MRTSLILLLTLLLFTLPTATGAQAVRLDPCTPWTQVNADAFGMGAGPDHTYVGEEGFEVVVFRSRLYLGMEADNSLGARLWRTKVGVITPRGQEDWEEVIADEGLWGDPNTTGNPTVSPYYSGGLGATYPPADVVIGAGHPAWSAANYVNWNIRNRLLADAGAVPGLAFVERIAGSPDGGLRLLAAAADPEATRLVGLFGGQGGNLEYRLADSSGANPENPTLAQMTRAALAVLSRQPGGFVLLVEGGAIDWAAHNNNLDQVVGEVLDFNAAVKTVTDWVDDPATPADWSDTLVIVTADHETGYLTAGPGLFPDRPLGPVNAQTLALEKPMIGTGRCASWRDSDGDGEIDAQEQVYWAWNSGGHTNSLVPVYMRGAGVGLITAEAVTTKDDPVRGDYIDNTDLFRLIDAVTTRRLEPLPPNPPAAPRARIFLNNDDVILTWPVVSGATAYEVWRGEEPFLNPGDPGADVVVIPVPTGNQVHHIDFGAAQGPGRNLYYVVRAIGPGVKSAIGPRVGLFQAVLTVAFITGDVALAKASPLSILRTVDADSQPASAANLRDERHLVQPQHGLMTWSANRASDSWVQLPLAGCASLPTG